MVAAELLLELTGRGLPLTAPFYKWTCCFSDLFVHERGVTINA